MSKTICFITTGDIKQIATSKRALGLANPLSDLGWDVSIIMEDTEENRHRVSMECDERTKIYYFDKCNSFQEVKRKNGILQQIKPDFVYVCACVIRNMIKTPKSSRLVIEHSELPTLATPKHEIKNQIKYYFEEYYSILCSDGLLNASGYLQYIYKRRVRQIGKKELPMLYFPYAFSTSVCRIEKMSELSIQGLVKREGSIFLTYLGSLSKAYKTFDIVKAFEKFCKTHSNVKLLLLGNGGEYDNIQQFVREKYIEDKVWMPGYIAEEDISIYFSLTDIFLLPMNDTVQDWARCPSKLYMYLPYRKPIITAKIGEPYEVLGAEGVYYDPNSMESICEAIEQCIEKIGYELNINPDMHTWEYRAYELDKWLKENF